MKTVLTLSLTLSLTLKKKKETKERNLEKGGEGREPSGFELKQFACNNPTNCARWQFVTNYLISLPFIAQHVIDKKLVLSLTRLSFPLVRFRLNRDPADTSVSDIRMHCGVSGTKCV